MNARRQRQAHPGRPAAGFTLIEVLVAFTVLALLSSLLASGLQIASRAWAAGNERADAAADLRLAHAWLRRSLAAARTVVTHDDGDPTLHFEGESDRLRFIAELPEHVTGGGLHDLTISHEGTELRLAHVPFDAGRDGPPAQEHIGTVVLSEDIDALEFEYYGAERPSGAERWRARWESDELLPALIVVRVKNSGGAAWPDLVVRVRVRQRFVTTKDGTANPPAPAAADAEASPQNDPATDTGAEK